MLGFNFHRRKLPGHMIHKVIFKVKKQIQRLLNFKLPILEIMADLDCLNVIM